MTEIYSQPGPERDRLTHDISLGSPHDPLTKLDQALTTIGAAASAERRIGAARKEGAFDEDTLEENPDFDITEAYRISLITGDEAVAVARARNLAREVIEVDDFETGALFQTMQDAQQRASQEPI